MVVPDSTDGVSLVYLNYRRAGGEVGRQLASKPLGHGTLQLGPSSLQQLVRKAFGRSSMSRESSEDGCKPMATLRMRPGLRNSDPKPNRKRSHTVGFGARRRGRRRTNTCCSSRRFSATRDHTPSQFLCTSGSALISADEPVHRIRPLPST